MKAIIDIGTILIHAALAAQTSHIIVRHRKTGKEHKYKNITEWWGRTKARDGGELAKINEIKKSKGQDILLPDDFDIEQITELITDAGISPQTRACGRLKNKIDWITNQSWCDSFIICHGVGDNFRYDEAHTQPYKSGRATKPAMFDVVKDYMLSKYKNNLYIVSDAEDDDGVCSLLWEDWIRSGRNHSNLTTVGAFIDKDVLQVPCYQFNFDKPELGLIKIDSFAAASNFATQLLRGDITDTIPSLPKLTDELCVKYSIRKTKGVGASTAENLLKTCTTIPELFERVVEAYRAYYGEDKKPFTSFRGEVFEWNWLDHLNERFQLLRLRTDVTKPVGHVADFLLKCGVNI